MYKVKRVVGAAATALRNLSIDERNKELVGKSTFHPICARVKSGKFGQSSNFGQRTCFFHFLIIGIKIKLTKQTVKIVMRRLIKSRLIWIFPVCKCMSEFTRCPKLPDFTLMVTALCP